MISNSKYFKVVLLGNGGAGKTSLLKSVLGQYDDSQKLTVGVSTGYIYLNAHLTSKIVRQVKVSIWDFGGQERFWNTLSAYMTGAKGAIYLFDCSKMNWFKNSNDWITLARTYDHTLPIVLTRSKSDLNEEISESEERILESVQIQYEIPTRMNISSKYCQNNREIFKKLVLMMISKYIPDWEVENLVLTKGSICGDGKGETVLACE